MYQALVYKRKPFAASKVAPRERSLRGHTKKIATRPDTSADQHTTYANITLPSHLVTSCDVSKGTGDLGEAASTSQSLIPFETSTQKRHRRQDLAGSSCPSSPNKRLRPSMKQNPFEVRDTAASDTITVEGTNRPAVRLGQAVSDASTGGEETAPPSSPHETSPSSQHARDQAPDFDDEENGEEPAYLRTNKTIMAEVPPGSSWDMSLRL